MQHDDASWHNNTLISGDVPCITRRMPYLTLEPTSK